jgi:transcriptional regulator GlxA family with amidase domain
MIRHVTVVGFKRALGTSLTIPVEMLHAADLIARIGGQQGPRLQIQVVSPDGANIPLTAGLELVCRTPLDAVEDTDLLIIPALWGNPVAIVRQQPALLAWLEHHSTRNTLICAVGTGSFFLAEAGLLSNKVATTHWYYFEHFARLYPEVLLQRERFITRAGNLYCAGSVNSVRDVMLHIIEEHYRPEVANQVSRHFTHEVKRSYTSAVLKNAPHNYHKDETIVEIQEWLHNQFHTQLSLEMIAGKFGMSVRTLNRRFRLATGRTPLQYLQQIRLDHAKELLRTSNLAVAEVAFSSGYPDASYFSAQFRKNISLSPRAYRDLVRKKLFEVQNSS